MRCSCPVAERDELSLGSLMRLLDAAGQMASAQRRLTCDGCFRYSDPKARGWQGFLEHEEGGAVHVVLLCPECAVWHDG
jgi:hypothetical protein